MAAQPDDPYGTVTRMVCCWPQPAGASRQSVNVLAWAAIASTCPPGPRASVAAHLGSAGSVRHDAPGPARVAACVAFRMMPTEPPGPIAVDRTDPVRSGAERVHRVPSYQPAMVPASGPRPTCSSATRPVPAEASRSTSTSSPAFGTAGPAACQRPPLSVKMPAKAGRPQPVPSTGAPALPNATAVRPVTWQGLPAGVAASAWAVIKRVHPVPPYWPSLAPPL